MEALFNPSLMRGQQSIACKTVAEQAKRNPLWADYSSYCLLREQGLRREAFSNLSRFIDSATQWTFPDQKEFVLWLCDRMDSVPYADYGPFPRPIRDRLFRPFFDYWVSQEPTNDFPLVLKARYLGDHDDYAAAIAINPTNQRARSALALDCIDDIDFATHHLPQVLVSEPDEAKRRANEAREHIRHLTNHEEAKMLTEKLCYSEGLLDDWIAYQQAPSGNFSDWCKLRGRNYRWSRTYYYVR